MNKEIEKWLQDTKRTMEAGIQLFERCAPRELRAKYLLYFQANKNAKAHETPYSMLINKLTFIQRNNLAVQQVEAVKVVKAPVAPAVSIEDRPLTQLDSAPKKLQPKVERIKEIVPMIAALTAKIADKNLPLAEAKEISEEIVALETERRKLWGDIDAYANATPAPKVEEEVVLPTTIAEKNNWLMTRLMSWSLALASDAVMMGRKKATRWMSRDKSCISPRMIADFPLLGSTAVI